MPQCACVRNVAQFSHKRSATRSNPRYAVLTLHACGARACAMPAPRSGARAAYARAPYCAAARSV
eukprot:8726912-Lingulodinium_polyedra.AAC.1